MLRALKKGEIVANPQGLKSIQAVANSLVALYVAIVPLANALGLHLHYDPNVANAATGAILAAGNVYATLASSDKVGL